MEADPPTRPDPEQLARVPLFASLSREQVAAVARLATVRRAEAGRRLVGEGTPGYAFFVLLEGTASVTSGEDQLAQLGPGDFFGEIALSRTATRTATVTATSPLRLAVMRAPEFLALQQDMPDAAARLEQAMEERLRRHGVGEPDGRPQTTQRASTDLWGDETRKAVENFDIARAPIPASVARWLGRIKAAAARVNGELGLLEPEKAHRIAAAADRVAAGEFDDQFPIDVFQTGSGTSSNMNANEVIAALAGDGVHPNDDVNMGQSSNDVFPSAVHLAALEELTRELIPALERLAASLGRKAAEFDDVVKSGRTHLMDAVPVTLGQEFAGYAAQVRQGIERVRGTLARVGQVPLGGTAVGTGLNTHPEFAERVRQRLTAETGLEVSAPADPFEAQAARDALVETSGALKAVAVSLTKIANDLRLMGSGPRAGLAEIFLPELQKGSSIMPGKVNPVIPEVVTQVAAQVIGNDAAVTVGGLQGHFELNVFVPLIARNLLDSVALLARAATAFADKCVDGIEANREACERYAELTLSAATALNPYIGYDRATEIVKEAAASGRPLREVARDAGVPEDTLDRALDYRAMAKPRGG